MAGSFRAEDLIYELRAGNPTSGGLKKLAGQIKVDHALALELWATGDFNPRLLATLIFDKKLLSEDVLECLAKDMLGHEPFECDQLTDWLLAHQLMKDRKLTGMMATWENHPSPIHRRLFWYHQARLRWTGQTPPDNSASLLDSLESKMANAERGVQWAMNFCACQIGVHEPEFRSRCIRLGEKIGLYKDERVSKNCTPSYLPEFIRIEVAKRT